MWVPRMPRKGPFNSPLGVRMHCNRPCSFCLLSAWATDSGCQEFLIGMSHFLGTPRRTNIRHLLLVQLCVPPIIDDQFGLFNRHLNRPFTVVFQATFNRALAAFFTHNWTASVRRTLLVVHLLCGLHTLIHRPSSFTGAHRRCAHLRSAR